jgi:outer membrane receptor protein involved in Fe transport
VRVTHLVWGTPGWDISWGEMMRVQQWIWGGSAIAIVVATTGATAQQNAPVLEEIEVTARHLPPSPSEKIYATTTLGRLDLDASGDSRLDDVLQTVPGFGLFRRQSSRAAHPTTQGVTLRGLGPSGAGRTLLLLNGVPQNDPFGGWIDWSRMQAAALESATVTRGGGAGPWGNTALAGVISVRTRAEDGNAAWGEVRGDSLTSFEGTVSGQYTVGSAQIFGTANGRDSDGPYLIRKDQRGTIDRRASNRGGWFQGGARLDVGEGTLLTVSAGYSDDRYINGIDLQASQTQITNGSLSLVHYTADDQISWEGNVYVRDQKFSSFFAAIDATRTTATPALDQFRVPSTAVGANGIVRMPLADDLTLEVGADIRQVEGETNERFFVVNNKFSRQRKAGGEQLITGAFAEVNWEVLSGLTLTAGGRVDYWRQSDGSRLETTISDGSIRRDDIFPSRDGVVGNFRFGARSELTDEFVFKALAYSGFRVPTINELYRPFRVGSDITEANPDLKPERMWGVEGSVEWTPAQDLTLSTTFFHVWINDAVSNTTITTTPGFNAELGAFVPTGGSLRQRRNLDRIEVDGAEVEALWTLSNQFDFAVRYLYTNPKVKRNDDEPILVGNRLAQVARHQGTLTAIWRPDDRWTLKVEGRAVSSQFDDDQNVRRLSSFAVLDLYADMAVTDFATLFISAENVFDRTIKTGISGTGVVSVGLPRVFAGGVRMRF